MTQQPGWRKRVLFAALLALIGLFLVEGAAFLGFYGVEGRPFSHARVAAERREIAGRGTGAWADSLQLELEQAQYERGAPRWLGADALHPYLGFVKDPAGNTPEAMRRWDGQRITDYGFIGEPGFLPKPDEDKYVIGVFGGSVAAQFCHKGDDRLLERLAGSPHLAGRSPVLVRVALGAYKQPQQVMALNYFLILGAVFDAVINLDGVNEMALPWLGYEERDVHPVFPRDWALRILQTPDLALQQAAGEIVYLTAKRAELARSFSRRPLSYSVAWNLVWKVRDNRLEAERHRARMRYETYQPPQESFAALGPRTRFRSEDDVYRELAAIWKRGSLQMHRLCEGSGIRYYHFLQPSPHVEGSKPDMSRSERTTVSRGSQEFKDRVVAGYPRLQEGARELISAGVLFRDLTQLFVDEERQVYIDGCCHMNELGNRIMADAIADVLLEDLARTTP